MLYDPKWEQKTDPQSLEALTSWLEQQPADKTYCYTDQGRCLAAQYHRHISVEYQPEIVFFTASKSDPFEYIIEWIGVKHPRTFGAALERARAIAAQ